MRNDFSMFDSINSLLSVNIHSPQPTDSGITDIASNEGITSNGNTPPSDPTNNSNFPDHSQGQKGRSSRTPPIHGTRTFPTRLSNNAGLPLPLYKRPYSLKTPTGTRPTPLPDPATNRSDALTAPPEENLSDVFRDADWKFDPG